MAKRKNHIEGRIERIYGTHCASMQLSIMRIPELFRTARTMLESGLSDQTVGEWMVQFVKADMETRA